MTFLGSGCALPHYEIANEGREQFCQKIYNRSAVLRNPTVIVRATVQYKQYNKMAKAARRIEN